MKVILITLVTFGALVFGAMYFASHVLDEKEKDERTQSCAVDSIEGAQPGSVFLAKNGQALTLRGWAGDLTRGRIPAGIDVLLVDGDRTEVVIGRGKAGIERPDVAAFYKNQALLLAGFSIAATASVPRAGDWELRLREHFPGRDIVCYADKTLRVGN